MSGHNKWSSIKHKKAASDQAKGKLFSKLANNISIAARNGADPQFNPSLKSAVDQARKQNMPQVNIERAIARASEKDNLETMLIEAYGPEGVGILIDVTTDSRNRTISELRSLFKDYDTKLADPGSLTWSFEKTPEGYKPKIAATPSPEAGLKVAELVEVLLLRSDIVGVYPAVDLQQP